MNDDSYTRYVRAYGKGTSGSRATDGDYGRMLLWFAFIPFSREAQVAVSLGIQDAMADKPLRTKTDVEHELRRLLG